MATSIFLKTRGLSCLNLFPPSELDLGSDLKDLVFVRTLECHDPVEVLYYTAKYEPICIYCSHCVEDDGDSEAYPQCNQCKLDKPPIIKK